MLSFNKANSALIPRLILPDITKITTELLVRYKLKGLILDVDNTLTTHGAQEISIPVEAWILQMKKANIPMVILSNNTNERVEPFAKLLSLPYVSFAFKPFKNGFYRAQEVLKIADNSAIAVVGDQIFTDIWGGNRAMMFTILVTPIAMEDSFSFRLRRRLERVQIERYNRKEAATAVDMASATADISAGKLNGSDTIK